MKKHQDAIDALTPGKVYTLAQLQNETSTGPGSYILQDLIAIGRIEKVQADGYRIKQ